MQQAGSQSPLLDDERKLPLTPNLDQHIFLPIGPAAFVSGEFECQPIAQVYFGSLNPVLLLLKARNRRRGAGAESNTGDLELQLPFYMLIAIELPLRHADLVIVLLCWVFMLARFADVGVLVSSSEPRQVLRAAYHGALVVSGMWIYFGSRILLLI